MATEQFHWTFTGVDLGDGPRDVPVVLPLSIKGKVLRAMRGLGELDLLFYMVDEVWSTNAPDLPRIIDEVDAAAATQMLNAWSKAFAERAQASLPKS